MDAMDEVTRIETYAPSETAKSQEDEALNLASLLGIEECFALELQSSKRESPKRPEGFGSSATQQAYEKRIAKFKRKSSLESSQKEMKRD